MAKKKSSKKKHGKRIPEDVQQRIIADAPSMDTDDLCKKYKISPATARRYKKLAEKQKKEKPKSVMDMKKALDVAKSQSLLVYTMEQMEIAMRRINEDRDKYTPKTQADTAVHCGKLILEIHNTLILMETPELPEGYSADDVEAAELIMEMMTDKQKEEVFARITGKSLEEVAAGKSNAGNDQA